MLQQLLVDEIVKRIVSTMNPLKIVLFGSYAYGIPDKDSDLDLVIIKEQVDSKSRESVSVWKLLEDIPIAKDILLVSESEYDFYKHEAGSVFRTIHEKGVEIYAR
jgi:predicted nucleotidyltransferase